jgi:predicted outer membrane repeat protein
VDRWFMQVGGAINADSNSTVSIYNSTLTDNSAVGSQCSGGAIYADGGSTVIIYSSTLTDNSAFWSGGAIYADDGSTVIIYNSYIYNSTLTSYLTGHVGGRIISADDGSTVSIYNSTLASNSAEGWPAVYADDLPESNRSKVSLLFEGVRFVGSNSISRYNANSNVTFACADGQTGAPFTMKSPKLDNAPPPELKCAPASGSYACVFSTHTCVPVPTGGDSKADCESHCGAPPDLKRRQQERDALNAFKAGASDKASDGWVHACQAGWASNDTDVCDRYGVTCDPPAAGAGYVTKIDLSSCGVTGVILANTIFSLRGLREVHMRNEAYKGLAGLHGTLPADLSTSSSLTVLDFNSNNLEGAVPDLSKLTSLVTVDMHYNRLEGTLPQLSSFAALTYVSFAGNRFTGAVPWGWAKALTNIEILGLANNRLSGPAAFVAGLPKLLVVFLRNNSFTGEIPGLPATVAVADFDHNSFTSISPDMCGKKPPPALAKPCGCTSDYPKQPFDTCCFAHDKFAHPPPASSCMASCFSEEPCKQGATAAATATAREHG